MCKFILASESGKFKEERIGEHVPASYRCDMGVGLLLYSSSRYSRTCLLNGLRCHAFRFWNTINSFIGTREEALKHFYYGSVYFYIEFSQRECPDLSRLSDLKSCSKGDGRRSGILK